MSRIQRLIALLFYAFCFVFSGGGILLCQAEKDIWETLCGIGIRYFSGVLLRGQVGAICLQVHGILSCAAMHYDCL